MEFSKIKNEIIKNDFIKEVKEICNKYTWIVIVLFVLVLLIIATPLWKYIDGLVTTGTLIAVGINIYINAKNTKILLQKVPIYFNDKKLNLDITRKNITRAELQGILGILRKDMKVNYNIEFLSKIAYLDEIYKIQRSELDKLKINITDEELKQFRDDIYETKL